MTQDEATKPDQPCDGRKHFWPDLWNDGDTCNCGAYYLYSDKDGGMVVEEVPMFNED